jgi:rod shape-determining protein MreC
VYDKKVRRRRAVLGLLVGVSLILLTGYFSESSGGPLHSVQRGVLEVLSPIQEGASRALKPVRDLAGWFGDTFHAKSERDRLRKENAQLRRQVVGAKAAQAENDQLSRIVSLDRNGGLGPLEPKTGRVIGRSPTLWYATIEVDLGSDDGVRVDQPVVNGDGLVGKVTDVASSTAVVTLITDHTSGVAAKVLDKAGDPGVVLPSVGDPSDLLVQTLPPHSRVAVGDQVVTAGTRAGRLESLFPPNLPIGTVTRVSPSELALSQQVHMRPAADLRHLNFVQILTRRAEGLRAEAP